MTLRRSASLTTTCLAVALPLLSAVPALGAPLTAAEVLRQFNLVVLGNATSNSHVDGRSFVGGMLTGGDYVQHAGNTPASAYAGLTVAGNASGLHVNGLGGVFGGNLVSSTVNSGLSAVIGNVSGVNFNSGAWVQGGVSGTNFNGGSFATLAAAPASLQIAAAAASSTDFASVMGNLSDALAALPGSGSSVSFVGNKAVFTAVAVGGIAVFDVTAIDTTVFSKGEFEFVNFGSANTVIINSDESTASIAANFLGGNAQGIGAKTIWNFRDADTLTLNNQFGGAVLAPTAALRNNQNIEGAVVVGSLEQYGEIHLQAFTGNLPVSPVPEPSTLALMAGGLLALAARRRALFTARRREA